MFGNSFKKISFIIISSGLASCATPPVDNIYAQQDRPAITPPIHDSRRLELNTEQNSNLMRIAGLLPSSPFTAGILDIRHYLKN